MHGTCARLAYSCALNDKFKSEANLLKYRILKDQQLLQPQYNSNIRYFVLINESKSQLIIVFTEVERYLCPNSETFLATVFGQSRHRNDTAISGHCEGDLLDILTGVLKVIDSVVPQLVKRPVLTFCSANSPLSALVRLFWMLNEQLFTIPSDKYDCQVVTFGSPLIFQTRTGNAKAIPEHIRARFSIELYNYVFPDDLLPRLFVEKCGAVLKSQKLLNDRQICQRNAVGSKFVGTFQARFALLCGFVAMTAATGGIATALTLGFAGSAAVNFKSGEEKLKNLETDKDVFSKLQLFVSISNFVQRKNMNSQMLCEGQYVFLKPDKTLCITYGVDAMKCLALESLLNIGTQISNSSKQNLEDLQTALNLYVQCQTDERGYRATWEKCVENQWISFSKSESNFIEERYEIASISQFSYTFSFGKEVEKQELDFKSMVLRGCKSSNVPLRRIDGFLWEWKGQTGWIPCGFGCSKVDAIQKEIEKKFLDYLFYRINDMPPLLHMEYKQNDKAFAIRFDAFVQIEKSTQARFKLRRLADFLWEWTEVKSIPSCFSSSHVWTEFTYEESYSLEKGYLGNDTHSIGRLEFTGEVHNIHFDKMTMSNPTTGTKFLLRRFGGCCWGWGDNECWRLYDIPNMLRIERCYQSKKGVAKLTFGNISVDPFRNIHKDDEYVPSKITRVKRIAFEIIGNPDSRTSEPQYPITWDAVDTTEQQKLFTINSSSQEYKMVEARFLKTCKEFKIVKIERLQNDRLWKPFSATKQSMNSKGSKGANEMLLFHGTSWDTIMKINTLGFNRNFVSTHVYGKGIYFARDASYSASDRYSPPSPARNGNKYMYLARVLVGEFCVGKDTDMAPSKARHGSANANDLCDSTVDDQQNPSIFVTYHDSQQYPEHLITFLRATRAVN